MIGMAYDFMCPGCRKKLFSFEARERKYGKIVRECKYCGKEYIDPRMYEPALEGIPADEFSILTYLIVAVVGGLLIWRAVYLFGVRQLGVSESIQWLLPTVFLVLGIAAVTGGIAEIIMIKTGIKARKMQKKYEESQNRLKDRGYISALKRLGYKLPEEYDDMF